ncbi:hypothetical protein F5Y16DRAFT_358346 [Xylariaceae sp. FL0255]|nr:hypothetical protein F5Y16DRAFT_358346 [Xylariaceae sp. FL0255]
MAKEKAMKKEKSHRQEKVARDAVTKSKKAKKDKKEKTRAQTPSDESDSEAGGAAAVKAESPSLSAVDAEVEDDLESSTEKKKKSKRDKKEKKVKKQKVEENGTDGNDDAEPAVDSGLLFSLDTNPTPVDLATIPSKEESARAQKKEHKAKNSAFTLPPSGLNRLARRRIKLIERQRAVIKKKMGIPPDSQDQAEEVQAAVDAWTEDFDGKTAIRLEKKSLRKAKESARLRNKNGKVLAGRRLKEKEKHLRKMDKKAEKKAAKLKGISTNSA